MSEQTIFNISTEIYDQHLQVRLNDSSLFCLNMPTAERYQLTLEQDAGQYVIWMRQSNNGFARLFSTEDQELASLIMNTTADVLTRMAMTTNPVRKAPSVLTSKWKWFAPGVLCLVLAAAWLAPQLSGSVKMPVPAAQTASVPVISQAQPAAAAVTPEVPVQQAPQVQNSNYALSQEAAAEARALLAERLKNGAAKQEFTIRLSSGHERSLYIFLDPECPNCRIFEPTVQALAEDYNVEIFPVTLIGKTRTADEVVPLLCSSPEKRAQMWKVLNDTGAGMLNLTDKAKTDVAPAACDAGKLALARNDLAFELYRMPGTPTVISDDGRMIPLQAMASDAALKSFLNTRK
ncbi:thioredoxin-like protein [Serratia fonticola]|uniref:Thioredoxin-like protein n=1 Tax=Serratia fonticola TaxID=47917 RepID=A0A559SH12_SERFO|nr:thioredoxin fold domain-containing protein [Serratia fonticola]TQI77304.1 thioredoxin-like protein [Serratia fonticola]TQI93652.1 thioredoxin-like protein [Serratia fonticola]TVZ61600.1 thioredoxin-like protein [Serratia fonticola]